MFVREIVCAPMENTSCTSSYLQVFQLNTTKVATGVSLGLGAASITISCVDIGAFFAMKLHHKVTYRMAMYQVLCSMLLAMSMSADVLLLQYIYLVKIAVYAFLILFTTTKYLFNMWLTVHVFIFTVYYRNIGKLEYLYVISAVLIPLVMTAVYVATVIILNCTNVVKEGFDVLVKINLAIVTFTSALVLILVLIILRRLCCTYMYRLHTEKYRLILCEILPLLGYSVSTLLSSVPIYKYIDQSQLQFIDKFYAYEFVLQGLNVVNGLLFMAHIVMFLKCKKCQRKPMYVYVKVSAA